MQRQGETSQPDRFRLAHRVGLETFELEDEAIVYDLARDTVHYLNRTARRVWECCDGVRSIPDIRRELLTRLVGSEFPADEDLQIVERDIGETLNMLQRDGLLHRSFNA